jgi:hypothetical protein
MQNSGLRLSPLCPSTHTCNTHTHYTVAPLFVLSQQADLTSSRESASHCTLLYQDQGLSTPHCGTSSICLAAASLIIFSQDADTCSCIVPFLMFCVWKKLPRGKLFLTFYCELSNRFTNSSSDQLVKHQETG